MNKWYNSCKTSIASPAQPCKTVVHTRKQKAKDSKKKFWKHY